MNIVLPCEILVPDIDSISYAEWIKIRRSGIGGSDAAAAVGGLNPWKSQRELWEEKANGYQSPRSENESMIWGKLLEPVIKEEFCRRTGSVVHPMLSMLQHPVHKFMLADLDGVVEDRSGRHGVFEVKTTGSYNQAEWDNDRVPDHYMLQVQHYLSVTGLDHAIICVLIGGNTMRWTTVHADYDLIADMIKLETQFWSYVVNKTPPPVDGSAACSELLARKYPKSTNPTPLILPAEADGWIQDWNSAKADEEAAVERKRLAENKLKEVIGDHEKAISPSGVQVAWKSVQSSRIDSSRLKTEQPAMYEKYLSQTSQTRRFSVSATK